MKRALEKYRQNAPGIHKGIFCLCLFTLFFCLYCLISSDIGVLYKTDSSQMRFSLVKSLIENQSITVPEAIGLIGTDGNAYSWWGIGGALLSMPFYVFAKLVGLDPAAVISLLNQIATALTVVLLYLLGQLLGYSRRISLILGLTYGLCTFAFPLAKHPFDHPLETLFVTLAWLLAISGVHFRREFHYWGSGASLGMAFLIRPTSVLALFAVALYLAMCAYKIRKNSKDYAAMKRFVLGFLFAFLPFIAIYGSYNLARFDSFFESGYTLIAQRAGVDFFTGSSFLTGLAGLILSPGKGFFYYSPVCLVVFLSYRMFFKKHHKLAIAFSVQIVLYLLLYSKNIFWHGDWAWGPRYLLVITPLVILMTAEFWRACVVGRQLKRILAISLVAIALLVQVVGSSVDFFRYFSFLNEEAKVDFVVIEGPGIQPIIEPPTVVYFQPQLSPLFLQWFFLSESLKEPCKSDNPWQTSLDYSWWPDVYCRHNLSKFFMIVLMAFLSAFLLLLLWRDTAR